MSQASVTVGAAPSVKKKVGLGLTAVFIVYFVANFYTYGLNVAGPRVAADLNGMALFSWSLSIPALAMAFATLTFGKLSDMFGRRAILVATMVFLLTGGALTALSTTFVMNIAARFVFGLGLGALMPLCFSVIGDLFESAERAKWSGLLAIPAGVTAFIAPTLTGMITDQLSWRFFFWLAVPFALICGGFILWGVPSLSQKAAHTIDFMGAALLAIASSTMILGFSWGGTAYPWASFQVIGLLVVSLVFWGLFIFTEGKAAEPMLNPQLLTNRTFLTASFAGLISFFGLLGILAYYPLFIQGVQGLSATVSGSMITPFSFLMAFMGVPGGLLLAKTKKYKWMYIAGYALLVLSLFGMSTFTATTPIWLGIAITVVAGLGIGTIPTVNVLVAQFSVPRRLMGVAIGGIFFFVMIGQAVAPSILGSAMNSSYSKALTAALPAGLTQTMDKATVASMGDPRVLLDPTAMTALKASITKLDNGPALFDQTVTAIRSALESSLRSVFLFGAITMAISFIMILTIPEVSMDVEVEDKKKKKK